MLRQEKGNENYFLNCIASIDTYIWDRIHHSSRPNPTIGLSAVGEIDIDINEPTYCYCKQVSFGDMIACDSENVCSL